VFSRHCGRVTGWVNANGSQRKVRQVSRGIWEFVR